MNLKRFLSTLTSNLGKTNLENLDDIIKVINKSGLSRDKVEGQHLSFIYEKLNLLSSAPDFSAISSVLPSSQFEPTIHTNVLHGVIVETRIHPALEYVVHNISELLKCPIQIFHGTENKEFILSSSISDLIAKGHVELIAMNKKKLSASEYNALLLSEEFWQLISGRKKILIFQTDSLICKQSDYSINDFMEFDYIGSRWDKKRPIGINLDGGNGGLSLRDWKKSTECLKRFPPQSWMGGEDGYYAFHLDIIGAKIGRETECAKFGTQLVYQYNSFGAHKISDLNKKSQEEFFRYCPEAINILD